MLKVHSKKLHSDWQCSEPNCIAVTPSQFPCLLHHNKFNTHFTLRHPIGFQHTRFPVFSCSHNNSALYVIKISEICPAIDTSSNLCSINRGRFCCMKLNSAKKLNSLGYIYLPNFPYHLKYPLHKITQSTVKPLHKAS